MNTKFLITGLALCGAQDLTPLKMPPVASLRAQEPRSPEKPLVQPSKLTTEELAKEIAKDLQFSLIKFSISSFVQDSVSVDYCKRDVLKNRGLDSLSDRVDDLIKASRTYERSLSEIKSEYKGLKPEHQIEVRDAVIPSLRKKYLEEYQNDKKAIKDDEWRKSYNELQYTARLKALNELEKIIMTKEK